MQGGNETGFELPRRTSAVLPRAGSSGDTHSTDTANLLHIFVVCPMQLAFPVMGVVGAELNCSAAPEDALPPVSMAEHCAGWAARVTAGVKWILVAKSIYVEQAMSDTQLPRIDAVLIVTGVTAPQLGVELLSISRIFGRAFWRLCCIVTPQPSVRATDELRRALRTALGEAAPHAFAVGVPLRRPIYVPMFGLPFTSPPPAEEDSGGGIPGVPLRLWVHCGGLVWDAKRWPLTWVLCAACPLVYVGDPRDATQPEDHAWRGGGAILRVEGQADPKSHRAVAASSTRWWKLELDPAIDVDHLGHALRCPASLPSRNTNRATGRSDSSALRAQGKRLLPWDELSCWEYGEPSADQPVRWVTVRGFSVRPFAPTGAACICRRGGESELVRWLRGNTSVLSSDLPHLGYRQHSWGQQFSASPADSPVFAGTACDFDYVSGELLLVNRSGKSRWVPTAGVQHHELPTAPAGGALFQCEDCVNTVGITGISADRPVVERWCDSCGDDTVWRRLDDDACTPDGRSSRERAPSPPHSWEACCDQPSPGPHDSSSGPGGGEPGKADPAAPNHRLQPPPPPDSGAAGGGGLRPGGGSATGSDA
eukprot:TRINITY_DN7737_c0_g1_i1.p1 TRINITY_DN7737_c0_g1~~TRINITY_DN7737_c0_g1_i1.p1  ORF type:complete len:594 (+),score=92.61 TRINITY_DN7737_c0_g1_i1:92-1873(+)